MTDPVSRLNASLEGRYRIERELGEGGMATVYLAEDLRHHRKVALKVLKPELAAVVGAERFLAEIETTANLTHPHILPLHDSGEVEGLLFYVMPYVEGESLREKLEREKQLPVKEAVSVAEDLAEALDYAHRHGVVHRDIKPANILIHEGRPLIADFGIALAVGAAGGPRLTETGLSLGTPYYMSPEQATGDQRVGPQTDIYALGCVLYEMLVGEPPYPGATAQAVLGKIIAGGPVSARTQRPQVPPNVDAAIRRSLEKLPADRFSKGQEVVEALQDPNYRYGRVAEVGAGAGGRGLTLGLLALSLLLAAAFAWSLLRSEPQPGVLRYTLPAPLEAGSVTDFGSNVALSPDGTKLVYAGARDASPRLWLRRRAQLDHQEILGTEGGHQPFFSPDGEAIGFITESRELKVVSLGGEPPLTLADSGVVRGGGSWGPDGYIYYVAPRTSPSDLAGIGRIPATGGEPELVTEVDTAQGEVGRVFPEIHPDGDVLLFAIAREQLYNAETREIAVADLETGETRVLLRGLMAWWAGPDRILALREDGALLVAPFDAGALELAGPAVPILEGIGVEGLATADLTVSATGTLAYAPSQPQQNPDRIIRLSREGATEEVDPGWVGTFFDPALSPDGERLALTMDQSGDVQVWIKQLPRGPLSKLTFEGAVNLRPEWSPQGESVTFASDRGQTRDLYRRRADGSSPPELLLDREFGVQEAEYTPDASWMVYRANVETPDIFALRLEGDTTSLPLVTTSFNEFAPALSPDGRWLAYSSDESGRQEVYVRPFPNAADARWLVSTNGGTEPRWSHSGEELFYRSGGNELVAAEVIPGNTFILGEQRALFSVEGYRASQNHSQYAVAPDDQSFIMIQTTQPEDYELIIVENFFEELRERVGG